MALQKTKHTSTANSNIETTLARILIMRVALFEIRIIHVSTSLPQVHIHVNDKVNEPKNRHCE